MLSNQGPTAASPASERYLILQCFLSSSRPLPDINVKIWTSAFVIALSQAIYKKNLMNHYDVN